ncbi:MULTISPECIES: OsmC family protein [Halobacteriovorax]|uniref:OsmC family peroxiredoxin n=1 Tax=Halobacteriovorax vibrionivorans TaxID=2152716 RepID=A0ABY0IGA3_9BACT|nr:OsmC family protein [Halobacteriovorax vibrionivorans]RZF21544.1 OsmC family peroxiredoxin [Halobacteriovorax vibrionivorans]
MSVYTTSSHGESKNDNMEISASGIEGKIRSTAPREFQGPDFQGDQNQWSPEDLFSASISSCYLLSFKELAKARKLDWDKIDVKADATLDRKDGRMAFTSVEIKPELVVKNKKDVDKYMKLLEETKDKCLVTNTVNCSLKLNPKIKVA